MTATERGLVTTAVVALLLASLVAPAGAVHDANREFEVQVATSGTATVVFQQSYNLSAPAEREAFEAYTDNDTRLFERRQAFADRLRRAAANGTERTSREMRITNVSASTFRVNDTGTVTLRARWVNLAGVYEASVVVNEPFTSDFHPNATLVVRGPEGFVRDEMAPPPDIARKNSAFWGEDTDLSGFSARFVNPDAVTSAPDRNRSTPEPQGVGRLVGASGFALVPALLVLFVVKRRELLDADGEGSGGEGD
jgi:hypothetical protein